MMNELPVRPLGNRILDFDIENRPLSYWVPDRPTAEVTAIAACWVDRPRSMKVWLLGRDDPVQMLREFSEMYAAAGMVTGHYILKHDLPILNGALIEYDLPTLQPKLVQDTKVHLISRKDIPATQEHLCDMLGIRKSKYRMSQAKWREANRLTDEGLALTDRRVRGDVRQHIALRRRMLELGLLKAPRVWRP